MARIRSIKPEFWTDETLAELPRDVRLLFIGLWNHVDDDGRCVDNPRLIKAAVFPLDDDVTAEMVRRWLDELSTSARVVLYEASGKRFLQVSNFAKHQKIDRHTPSKLPAPDDCNIVHVTPGQSVTPKDSTNTRRGVVEPSSPDLGSGSRIKDQDLTTPPDPVVSEQPPPAPPVVEDDGFAEFWHQYPRRDGVRVGKAQAHAAWKRIPSSKRPDVMRALDTYAAVCNGKPKDAQRFLSPKVWPEYLEADTVVIDEPTEQAPTSAFASIGFNTYVGSMPEPDYFS